VVGREHGDPFENGLSDNRRGARLVGRKLVTRNHVGSRIGESLYKVERYVAFLPRRGSDGRGMVQFEGPHATRVYEAGETPPEWRVTREREHCVLVGEIKFKHNRNR
jgi:hypothetical protein